MMKPISAHRYIRKNKMQRKGKHNTKPVLNINSEEIAANCFLSRFPVFESYCLWHLSLEYCRETSLFSFFTGRPRQKLDNHSDSRLNHEAYIQLPHRVQMLLLSFLTHGILEGLELIENKLNFSDNRIFGGKMSSLVTFIIFGASFEERHTSENAQFMSALMMTS